MQRLYERLIHRWETRLATRDTNRVVRPFEYGLEWLQGDRLPAPRAPEELDSFCSLAVAQSAEFFTHETPTSYRLEGDLLTFTSPSRSPYPENNSVYARYFRASGDRGRAVLVMPQWNADAEGHIGLCRLLNRYGITALRMSKAYHDRRMPKGLDRADYHMSSNVGRTLHAAQQSVRDARACLDWLQQQGHTRLGILGTSLGSCIAFLTAAHDSRVTVGVFNHVSTNVADVVWTGISTRHVRESLAAHVSLETLRRYWAPISPATYLDRMTGRDFRSLLIWARYDTTFLPEYSRQVLDGFRQRSLLHRVLALPCAHYTMGSFPFKFIDGFSMCRYLAREM